MELILTDDIIEQVSSNSLEELVKGCQQDNN